MPGQKMQPATLFLTVGLPGTGKTTAARRLEAEHNAVRLTKDEWVKALFGPENPTSASAVIEGRLIGLGLRAVSGVATNARPSGRQPRTSAPRS